MNPTNSPHLKGNLKTLMATGGVLAGAGTASQAAIIFTELNSGAGITISATGDIYFNLFTQDADTIPGNVTGGPQFHARFQNDGTLNPAFFGYAYSMNNTILGSYSGQISGGHLSYQLSGGASIGPGSSGVFYYYSWLTYEGTESTAQWDPGDRAYIGLRVNDGGNSYAWADVQYHLDQTLTLYGFAYEDSGGQILAGAVPEPATTGAIAAVFAGAVGAFELRRRRKAVRCSEGR